MPQICESCAGSRRFLLPIIRRSGSKASRQLFLYAAGRAAAVYALWALALSSVSAQVQSSVLLAWNPSTAPDIASYNVYDGVASGDYTNVVSVERR